MQLHRPSSWCSGLDNCTQLCELPGINTGGLLSTVEADSQYCLRRKRGAPSRTAAYPTPRQMADRNDILGGKACRCATR